MDYVTRQFIHLAHKLRADLRKGLTALRDYLKQERDATRDYRKTQDAKQIPQVTIASLPYGVQIRKSASDKRDEEKYQRKYLRTQWLTIWVVTAYAGFAALQWVEMKKTTDAAERTAKSAEDTFQLTQKIFAATQAARFSFKTDSQIWGIVTERWAEMICINQGEMSATNVTGRYTLTRQEGKRIVQQEWRAIKNPIVVKSGYVGGDPIFFREPSDLAQLAKERITISIFITYGNGIESKTTQSSCSELTINSDLKGGGWGECESTDNMKAHSRNRAH